MNVVGNQVRNIRKALRLTQSELAAKLNLLGWDISRGTLAKIEAGVRGVTDVEITYFAQALETSEQTLFPN